MANFFNSLSATQRFTFAIAVCMILGASIWFWVWSSKSHDAVLFGQLSEEDAATVIENLEKLKVDYKIGDSGAAILVDESILHETRIKLASSGLPMKGGMGFELFDGVDYGLTEFSQKILLQRALQGELARTISSIDEVRFARVHIVLGDKGLFKESVPPKASVTIVPERDQSLSGDQVSGIQRLVASAVSGLEPDRVTVSDSRGVVLSKSSALPAASVDGFMDAKTQYEAHLVEKVSTLLTDIYTPDQVSVKINVDLNFDQRQSELEEILPVSETSERGFLVRDKVSSTVEPYDQNNSAGKPASTTTDKTYDYGKRIEKVIYGVGQLRRMTVSIAVPDDESLERMSKLKSLIAAAIGLNAERGDTIEIHALISKSDRESGIGTVGGLQAASGDLTLPLEDTLTLDRSDSAEGGVPISWLENNMIPAVLVAAVVLMAALALAVWRRSERTLSDEERNQLLNEVRNWLAESEG